MDDGAVFMGGLGSVKLVVREGDVVPGTGGETIQVINTTISFSQTHGVLWGGSLNAPGVGVTTANNSVLAIAKPGAMTLIAREGDACPGLPGYTFGNLVGSFDFGSAGISRINDRGQVIFQADANDGVVLARTTWTYDPVLGLQLQLFGETALGDVIAGDIVWGPGTPLQFASGDGNPAGFTEDGDFVLRPSQNNGACILRGHVGSLQGKPSAVPAAGGVPHTMDFDVGPAFGNNFYFILATAQYGQLSELRSCPLGRYPLSGRERRVCPIQRKVSRRLCRSIQRHHASDPQTRH
jgi:hypothetical protein